MTQIMIAPEMTNGQIENAVSKLRDAMRKHRSQISSKTAQQVLGTENLGMMLFAPFRERAEVASNLTVCMVTVNRNRTAQEALDATHCKQVNIDRKVVDCMPKALSDEVEIVFFRPDLFTRSGVILYEDLEEEYELRGLKPADPFSVAALNEADPAFIDEKPHSTHWKDEDDKWCCIMFARGGDNQHRVYINRNIGWFDQWWFAGVRK